MIEEDAEIAEPVVTHAATDDPGTEGNEVPGGLAHEPNQASVVAGGIAAGQVADDSSLNPDLNRVRVVLVVRIRDEDGVRLMPNGFYALAADDGPKRLLVVRLADDLQRL